jgi:hypothetical protein
VLQYQSDKEEVRKKLGLTSGAASGLPQPINAYPGGGLPPPMNNPGLGTARLLYFSFLFSFLRLIYHFANLQVLVVFRLHNSNRNPIWMVSCIISLNDPLFIC